MTTTIGTIINAEIAEAYELLKSKHVKYRYGEIKMSKLFIVTTRWSEELARYDSIDNIPVLKTGWNDGFDYMYAMSDATDTELVFLDCLKQAQQDLSYLRDEL
jgi:hypothetical protein